MSVNRQLLLAALPSINSVLRDTDRSATLYVEASHRCTVVHGVECGDLVDSHGRHFQDARHFVHDADAGEAMLSLPEVEQRHHCRFLVLARVSAQDLLDELLICSVELERDIEVVFGGVAVLSEPLEGDNGKTSRGISPCVPH